MKKGEEKEGGEKRERDERNEVSGHAKRRIPTRRAREHGGKGETHEKNRNRE